MKMCECCGAPMHGNVCEYCGAEMEPKPARLRLEVEVKAPKLVEYAPESSINAAAVKEDEELSLPNKWGITSLVLMVTMLLAVLTAEAVKKYGPTIETALVSAFWKIPCFGKWLPLLEGDGFLTAVIGISVTLGAILFILTALAHMIVCFFRPDRFDIARKIAIVCILIAFLCQAVSLFLSASFLI